MKLNFQQFSYPKGVSGKEFVEVDIRETFANAVYNTCDGIAAHHLAHKIYGSEGTTDFDDREFEIIKGVIDNCRPALIDGLHKQIDENNNPNTNN